MHKSFSLSSPLQLVRTPNHRVPVDQVIGRNARDSGPTGTEYGTAAVDIDDHRAGPAVERHREVGDPGSRDLLVPHGSTSNRHIHRCSRAEQDVYKDPLLGDLSRGDDDGSAGDAAVGPAVGARRCGVGAVVIDDFLGRGVRRAAVLVCGDVLGKEVAPVVVGVLVDVAVGVGGDAGGTDGADVVGFAVVVPGDNLRGGEQVGRMEGDGGTNLDKVGLDLEDLIPASRPEVVASQDPVLAPLWEFGVEPW